MNQNEIIENQFVNILDQAHEAASKGEPVTGLAIFFKNGTSHLFSTVNIAPDNISKIIGDQFEDMQADAVGYIEEFYTDTAHNEAEIIGVLRFNEKRKRYWVAKRTKVNDRTKTLSNFNKVDCGHLIASTIDSAYLGGVVKNNSLEIEEPLFGSYRTIHDGDIAKNSIPFVTLNKEMKVDA
jgi:hypothetical protein